MIDAVEDSEALFKLVHSAVSPILGDDSSLYDNDSIDAALVLIERCESCVEKEHLISKNEEVEDINTSVIKFLFLPYYAGKCHQNMHGMEGRLINVLAAKESFSKFLKECIRLDLVHSADHEGHSSQSSMTPDAKRQYKIDKYKRDKAAKAKINDLRRQLYIARKDETDGGDHDGELRELYLIQLQCYARESMDEIEMINQEITMLRFQEQQAAQQQGGGNSVGRDDVRVNQRDGASQESGANPGRIIAPPPQPGPGISVTRTFKVGDQIMFSRDTVKANVFGSHIAPPSMTLEEFGDQQKAEALERQAQQAEQGAAHANRRYKQLQEDGDEDDAELVDKAAEKDRAWDDWKDNNPRGWGNKAGKRF